MYEDLQIIRYPDPILKKVARPVEAFNADLQALSARMFDLMRQSRGVGLAAPQVGISIRMFVMNHTGEAADDRAYVNPELSEAEGNEEDEEGCLSLPGINVNVVRDKTIRIRAKDLDGKEIDQTASGYVARIWQHEFDHLNGTMIIDRMGMVAKMTFRKKLREMEDEYKAANPPKKKIRRQIMDNDDA